MISQKNYIKFLLLDFSDKKVVCGGHQADSCAQCPMDIGESWCNGECAWCEGKCQIKGKNCGEFPNISKENKFWILGLKLHTGVQIHLF